MLRWSGWMWLALAGAPTATSGQQAGAGPERTAGNPSLTASGGGVRDEASARELRLRRFDLEVETRGAVARGVATASFAGSDGTTLEGDFRLALPADAVVTGYALDIGGRLVDGVLVDRPRAQAVYEARVRRRIDPGLAEVADDGAFRTRVFPIGPGGRTIRVAFTAPVPPDGLRMPVRLAAPTEGWSVAVRVGGVAAPPTLVLPGAGEARFAPSPDGFAARAEGRAEALDGDLLLGRAALPDALASRHATGERYLQLSGDLPAAAATRPRSVRVYWDRSRSRMDGRIEAELGVLRRLLAAWGPQHIELVAFNSSAPQRSTATGTDDAVRRLRAVRYRGATSFAGLSGAAPVDRCLLFSDGAATVDRRVRFAPGCPLDAVSSSPRADRAMLRYLAIGNGGRFEPVGADDEAQVAARLAEIRPAVAAVVDERGAALPFSPLPSAPGRWALLARAPTLGGVAVRITAGTTLARAVPADAPAFDGEGALLARDALAPLGATERRADYLALSRRYGVASPSLSFLVLETPQDYVEADVAPPRSYSAASRDEYRRLLKDASAEKAQARRDRFDEVLEGWRERVAWWAARHDPRIRAKTSRRAVMPTVVFAPPPPMAEPSPPPPPSSGERPLPPAVAARAASSEDADASGNIVVTAARVRTGPALQIDAWQPDRPYLAAFDAAPERFDALFPEQERLHGSLPAFYLDVAEWLRRRSRAAEATEMVLAALELGSANEVTLGIVADRLGRYGAIDRAVELRERHAALDPLRPQPRRFLALALAQRARLRPAGARADLGRAVDLLAAVALEPLEDAWDGIDMIALTEANALIPRLRRLGGAVSLDPRLVRLLDADVRVVVDWTTDATDLDLWVDEPTGERAIYGNPRTAIGGHLSNDMTSGYGPEEYLLRRAVPGTYAVQANVFAPDRIDPNGASLVTARLIRDFGRATEREEAIDIEVADDKDGERRIGRIVVPRR